MICAMLAKVTLSYISCEFNKEHVFIQLKICIWWVEHLKNEAELFQVSLQSFFHLGSE